MGGRTPRTSAAVVILVSLLVGSFGAGPTADAISPAACSHPTVRFYPGDPVSKLRYGETVVHFDICPEDSPNEWGRSVSTTLNSTGSSFGYSVQAESILLVADETNPLVDVGYFEVLVVLKWCLPAKVPPCSIPRLNAEVKAVDVGGAVAATLGRTWDNGESVVIFRDP